MIGFDLQEVGRIKNPQALLDKIALESEVEYIQKFKCDFALHVASLWALKEAVFKALGVKSDVFSFKEIELCHNDCGAPFVVLHGKAKQCLPQGKKVEVSISHQPSVVGAVAILTEEFQN